jgi:hypothetical protein
MIGVTEYNWGSLGYPDGGIAQADVLGIFGREGLDIATLWTTVSSGSPAYNAFKIFTNYDGIGGSFGDLSVRCTVPDPDQVSAFASVDTATSELKVVVLNKYPSGNTPITMEVLCAPPLETAQVHQWWGTGSLELLPDLVSTGTSFTFSAPPYSATLLITSLCYGFPLDGPGDSDLEEARVELPIPCAGTRDVTAAHEVRRAQ